MGPLTRRTGRDKPQRQAGAVRVGFALVISLGVGLLTAAVRTTPPAHPSLSDPEPGAQNDSGSKPFRLVGEPTIRVGIRVGAESVVLSSPAGLHIFDGQRGSPLGRVDPSESLRIAADGRMLSVAEGKAFLVNTTAAALIKPAGPDARIFVDGKPYRGFAEVLAGEGDRVTAIGVLGLEDYLLGVVPLEIGSRGPEEAAAVAAQAVAARTYAVSHLGGHAELGFDVYGSVEDQVYGGIEAEREAATRAVRETAGVILVYDGAPIRAMYHSTCGGRTAAVEEVLDREPAPYLRSVSDRSPEGTDWCSESPRYRWTSVFSTEDLNGRVREAVGRRFGVTGASLGRLEHLVAVQRTESGRIQELAFRGPGFDLVLSRLEIRQALTDTEGSILNSTAFAIFERGDGLVELHGRGYGHGAGLCQWGAIGRARAGQSYVQILRAYYPGAEPLQAY